MTPNLVRGQDLLSESNFKCIRGKELKLYGFLLIGLRIRSNLSSKYHKQSNFEK